MAQSGKKSTAKGKAAAATTSNDNMLWMSGFVMLILGILSLFSVLSHFIHWASDLAALRNDESLSGEVIPYENICSSLGANIGYLLVDCSFGVFGVLLPVVITLLGWRVFRKNKLHFNHLALSAALLLVVGAVTMGLVGEKFDTAYDIGGRWGHACATDLMQMIGTFGTIMVLLTGWILTGVYINRNIISLVNRSVDGVVNKSEDVVDKVKERIARRGEKSQNEPNEEDIQLPVEPQAVVPEVLMARPETQTPKPEPQSQIQPQMTEQPQQVVEPQRETVILPPADEVKISLQEEIPSQVTTPSIGYNAEGSSSRTVYNDVVFDVEPNSGGKPNKIDVDRLLGREESVQDDAENKDAANVAEPMDNTPAGYDDFRFALAENHDDDIKAAGQNDDEVEGEIDEPMDDELSINVYEHPTKTLSEDELLDEPYNPLLDLEHYKKPHVSLLEDYQSPHKVSDAEIYENKCRIQETLKYFGIPIIDIEATVGPTVTLYEIKQAQGVKISKIQGLEKDIAQSLRAQGIRIIAPIPGKGTIGIEVPNHDKQIVSMYSSICSEEFQKSKAELPVVIGRTIQNENFTFDLAKVPHLLVAGATGQGKSVGLNAIVTSLLYRKHPAELKFVMIDPKMVEFSVYNKIEKHFLAKMESEDEAIVTEPKKAVCVLNSLVEEMGRRLELLKMATARNIVEYNQKFTSRRLNPNKGHRFLPYIVVIIDEFADLIMTAREVEVPVMRLAQKARAVGIHLIIATQRPDVKVITGGIKANFPSRIAFRVIQTVDSRTIIDQPGANQLIGRGDMLFSKDGELTRVQCALVETHEVERLTEFISKQQGYTEAYPLPDYVPESGDGGASISDSESSAPMKYDSLFGEVARSAVTNGVISISLIQRNYEVGFNRAGRIMLQLERAGIVGPQNGAKAREIKFYDLPSLEAKLQDLGVY